jgi:hypothetical protein
MGAEPPHPPAPPPTAAEDAAGAVWPAYPRWRRLAGPLADFVLPAPFLAPWPAAPRRPAAPGAPAIAAALDARAGAADGGDGGDGSEGDAEGPRMVRTALFLEAPPRLGLAAGLRLGRAGWSVVPLYGRWPAPGAVLPVERLTGWLLGVACALDATAPPGAQRDDALGRAPPGRAPPGRARLCLLLDSQRSRPASAGVLRRRLDNRYTYLAYLLPPPDRLTAGGVRRVLWAAPTADVPPDLQDYADALVRAGIVLDLVRLGALTAPGPPAAGGARR